MSERNPDQTSQETARLVLQMDAAISAFRAGQLSGVQALDAASQIVSGPSNDLTIGTTPGSYFRPLERPVLRRPKRAELAVLTAFADTYGAEMLSNSSLRYTMTNPHGASRRGYARLLQADEFAKRLASSHLASDHRHSSLLADSHNHATADHARNPQPVASYVAERCADNCRCTAQCCGLVAGRGRRYE
jgi:hypothetical protein